MQSKITSLVRLLIRLVVTLFLALFLLFLAITPFSQGAALAQPHITHALEPASAAGLITLTASSVGDPLPQIQCIEGYSATVYAEGLAGPHGLALNPAGDLYAAEAVSGQVSQVGANGAITPVVTGLNNPEGLTFDDQGNLYVVEDVKGGRVVKRAATNGLTSTLATGLDLPEGIIWVAGGGSGGLLYVTESNLEYALSISSINQSDYQTYVTRVSLTGAVTRILTKTGIITAVGGIFCPDSVEALLWSYTGDIVTGTNGLLYFSNELSGQEINGAYEVPFCQDPIPYHAESTQSIFTTNPATLPATETPFTDGLIAPEGLSFAGDGNFPLYVAEENIGNNQGRLSRVDAAGNRTTFCTGFETIEDVAAAQDGSFFVSEDATNRIILLKKSTTPPDPTDELVWLPIILRR
jgi:sugar lactone lactonase YvrE